MTTNSDDTGRPAAQDLPDGSSSNGSKSAEGEDTASGGGADQGAPRRDHSPKPNGVDPDDATEADGSPVENPSG